ncbi:unnamed protein product [Heterobilharzia americana]|nr:unnamed protein product [Heterobilharzia americana]
MNYQIGCYALFTCKDNITILRNSTLNVTQIVNPVKSVSLHFCRSARKINDSDPNSTIPLGNRSLLFHHIPIGHLIPKHHELKAISINFDAKCLPKGIPYGKEIKVSKAPQQLNASNVTNGLSNSTVTEGQHEKVESHQSENHVDSNVYVGTVSITTNKQNWFGDIETDRIITAVNRLKSIAKKTVVLTIKSHRDLMVNTITVEIILTTHCLRAISFFILILDLILLTKLFSIIYLSVSDDDEVIETTWIVKIGNKNVTDKDMLDYISKKMDFEDLLQNDLKKNKSLSSVLVHIGDEQKKYLNIPVLHFKDQFETEVSWITLPKKLSDQKIDNFLDKEVNLNHLLKMFLPTNFMTKQPRKFWYLRVLSNSPLPNNSNTSTKNYTNYEDENDNYEKL